MPSDKFLAARQISPDEFDRIITKKNQGGDGIDFLIGFRKDGSSAVQSIHFAKDKFDEKKAKEWLKKHKMKASLEADETTSEAANLSFDKIFRLVQDAIDVQYPAVPYDNEQPYEGACRYRISKIWPERALARKTIWSAETDPAFYLFPYSIEEKSDAPDVQLGDPVSMKLQIIAMDGSIALDMESASFSLDEEVFEEAGKRNAKKDAKAMNHALRMMMALMNDDDFDDETMGMMHSRLAAKSQKPVKMNKEDTTPISADMTESWNGLGGETLTESWTNVIEGHFDDKNLIVHNMAILGPVSKNGYLYPKETQAAARALFEGAKAYLNHPTSKEMGEARKVEDLIGEHKNIRTIGEKTYSDLHLLNTPKVRDYVLPLMGEGKTHLAGNSIVIRGSRKKGEDGVEYVDKILGVRSVDLVAEPATTKGLFEAEKFNTTDKVAEDTMEWTDVTVENLRKERPDLVEALLAGDKEKQKMATLEAENTALKEQNAKFAKDMEEMKKQQEAEAKERRLVAMVAESKIPDSVKYKEGSKEIKDHFRKALELCADEDGMKEMIAAWEATFPATPAQQTESKKQKIVQEAKVLDFSTRKPVDEKAVIEFAKAL